jgi:hypothetical protein
MKVRQVDRNTYQKMEVTYMYQINYRIPNYSKISGQCEFGLYRVNNGIKGLGLHHIL